MNIQEQIKIRKQRENNNRKGVFVDLTYIDMCSGDFVTGTFLSQLVYWNSLDQNGNSKLRIYRNDKWWIAKTNDEWFEEIRLSAKQIRRCIGILKKMELIEVNLWKFDGVPTNHFYFNWEKFIELETALLLGSVECDQREQSNVTKGNNRMLPKGTMEHDQRSQSLTKNTTENTTENTSENTSEIINQSKVNNNIIDMAPPGDGLIDPIMDKKLKSLFALCNYPEIDLKPSQIQMVVDRYGIERVILAIDKLMAHLDTVTNQYAYLLEILLGVSNNIQNNSTSANI